MKKIIGLLLVLMTSANLWTVSAQNKTEEPKGKAIIRIFTNFHTGFGQGRNDRGFELSRSYLGYQYDLGKGLQLKAVMDVGKSSSVDDLNRIAFIKNAQVSWKTGKLTLHGGLITTTQFKVQEDFWGYRYMMMSFQDYYKWGSSADLGISASYQLADWISADAIVVNGEGYKKVQKTDGLQYGLGATLRPVSGLTVRLYGSLNEGADPTKEDITNLATMVGYKGKSFSIAGEYNLMANSGNVKDANLYGISVYGTVKVNNQVETFLRYDQLSSKDDWNENKDESSILAGAQFKVGKYVKLAPNFRMFMPKKEGADNRYMAYISCYFGI
jgi:hypothetical protein